MVEDEPDDYNILIRDIPEVTIFSVPGAYNYSQSGLPYIITVPLIYFLEHQSLIPVLIMFLVYNLGSVIVLRWFCHKAKLQPLDTGFAKIFYLKFKNLYVNF